VLCSLSINGLILILIVGVLLQAAAHSIKDLWRVRTTATTTTTTTTRIWHGRLPEDLQLQCLNLAGGQLETDQVDKEQTHDQAMIKGKKRVNKATGNRQGSAKHKQGQQYRGQTQHTEVDNILYLDDVVIHSHQGQI
jgi:hypothetical protein